MTTLAQSTTIKVSWDLGSPKHSSTKITTHLEIDLWSRILSEPMSILQCLYCKFFSQNISSVMYWNSTIWEQKFPQGEGNKFVWKFIMNATSFFSHWVWKHTLCRQEEEVNSSLPARYSFLQPCKRRGMRHQGYRWLTSERWPILSQLTNQDTHTFQAWPAHTGWC